MVQKKIIITKNFIIATYSDLNSWMLYISKVKISRTIRNMSSRSKKQVHQKLSQISSPAQKMLIFLVDKDWINIIFCKKYHLCFNWCMYYFHPNILVIVVTQTMKLLNLKIFISSYFTRPHVSFPFVCFEYGFVAI